MTEAAGTIERIARLSYGRLVASLAVRLGGIAAAEDAFGDALMRALETWPERGVPDNPDGWLLRAARNRAIDAIRSGRMPDTYRTEIEIMIAPFAPGADMLDGIDPRVRLMFACAHPAIDPSLRAPLMLQVVLGLDAARMASVYLMSPGTLGQRLTRAKAKIERSGIPLTLPSDPADYDARLSDILAAIYAAYTVGHNGIGSGDEKATGLAQEALWLVSTICAALPDAAEAHGLFALILYTEARRPARRDARTGQSVPLTEQDTGAWRDDLIADAEQALQNASRNLTLGRFQIEASIQALHMVRRTTGATDWAALRTLYLGLASLSPTVGALTAQAAVEAEVSGSQAGLALLDAIEHDRRDAYQPWHATRAHLLARAGRTAEAARAFDRAIGLANDPADRAYLLAQRNDVIREEPLG